MKTNIVIAGDYKDYILLNFKGLILKKFSKTIALNNNTVKRYEVINQETQPDSGSIFSNAFLGDMLFGPVGAIVGGMSGKNKTTYFVAIEFENGAKSLVQLDGPMYKTFMTQMFQSGGSEFAENERRYKELTERVRKEKKEKSRLERSERINTIKTAKSWEEKLCAILGLKNAK